jgi:hypothetical protein
VPHILLLLMLLNGPGPVAPGLRSIALRDCVTVSGDQVTLGDLAELAPAEAAAEGGALAVTPAPPPGMSTEITRGYLRLRLRRAGLRLEGISFSGPDHVRVTRAAALPPPGRGLRALPPGGGTASGASATPAEASGLPPVPRGARLRLVLRLGLLTVETPAELVAAAVPGGACRVRTLESRVVMDARLLDSQTAEVNR